MTNTEIIKTIETNKMPNQTETIFFFVLSFLWVTGGCSPSTKCFLRYRYPLLWPYKRLLTFLFEPARPLVQIVIFRQPTGHKTRFDIFQTRKKKIDLFLSAPKMWPQVIFWRPSSNLRRHSAAGVIPPTPVNESIHLTRRPVNTSLWPNLNNALRQLYVLIQQSQCQL